MDNVLKIWLPAIVILFMTLYFYDEAAHRVYDIIFSAVLIVATSPLFILLAIIGKAKNGHAFVRAENDLTFSYPNNKIAALPRLLLVLIGKRRIMPNSLKDFKLPD